MEKVDQQKSIDKMGNLICFQIPHVVPHAPYNCFQDQKWGI